MLTLVSDEDSPLYWKKRYDGEEGITDLNPIVAKERVRPDRFLYTPSHPLKEDYPGSKGQLVGYRTQLMMFEWWPDDR